MGCATQASCKCGTSRANMSTCARCEWCADMLLVAQIAIPSIPASPCGCTAAQCTISFLRLKAKQAHKQTITATIPTWLLMLSQVSMWRLIFPLVLLKQ